MLLGYMLSGGPFEMYRIEVKGSSLCFAITKSLFKHFCNSVTEKSFLDNFLALRREERDRLVTFFIDLPCITYPNYVHKSLDYAALSLCAKKISSLLGLFNWIFPKKSDFKDKSIEECLEFFISKDPQLVCIETSYSQGKDYHACPVEVGYNNSICELLSKTYKEDTDFLKCEEVAFMMYQSLSTNRKRDFEKAKKEFDSYHGGFTDFKVRVRQSGTPHFIVPGNCACLGENPDNFKHNRGMFSHNLDTPLQQITLLTAIVSFWNDVLRPLYAEEKAKELLIPT